MNTIRVKYHEKDIPKIQKIENGDWIDLYAAETVFCPVFDEVLISLGVSMELPAGYEAEIRPRSSTFKNWGIIQGNSVGTIDESYCGDNDIWKFPAICLKVKESERIEQREGFVIPSGKIGVYIHKGDKICQFRIQKKMQKVEIVEVEKLGNPDRGGFGTTGRR